MNEPAVESLGRNGVAEPSGAGIWWQVGEKSFDGFSERGNVVVDGGQHDGMGGVEVAVGQVVAHSGDLAPRDRWFGVEKSPG